MNYPDWWTFYYLYAYERYASFRELAEGKSQPEPRWYTDGANFLIGAQHADGSWAMKDSLGGKTSDTAFATLFLLRSSKKSIEKAYGYGESMLVAGRGLSKETASVRVSGGKVLPVPRWTSAAELLPILQNRDGDAFDQGIAALEQLPPKEAEVLAARHAGLLRRLLDDRSRLARLAAIRAIANGGNLDLTPALVHALGDPDLGVAVQACDALRRLTRTPGKGTVPGQLTEQRRHEEIQHWKQWYLAHPAGCGVRRLIPS